MSAGDGTPRNLQTEWARLILASFADAGGRDVVLSPGSRSTPFVLAAVGHPRLRCWDLIDERSAGFFALGRARVTGRPALLICTSGTAAANYLPAVVEAGMAHVPLLVLTADRPVELVDCGANQTIDQLKIYGDHARRFVDLGTPQTSSRTLRAARRMVAQAFHTSLEPTPGAVHLNARAAKPLEPQPARSKAEEALEAEVQARLDRPIVRPSKTRRLPPEEDLAELAAACQNSRQGLIVCGPAAIDQTRIRRALARLGARTGFPIYCEPASQGRFRGRSTEEVEDQAVFSDALDSLLHSPLFRARHSPELVLQIGRCPTSGAWGRYLADHAGCEHWVIAAPGWQDSQSTATRILWGDAIPVLEKLALQMADRLPSIPADALDPAATTESSWIDSFRQAEERAWGVIDDEATTGGWSEGVAVRSVVSALPAGGLLALGNSLPIREADTWCRGSAAADLAVWSQRGASGIDGVLSGVAGAASAWGAPTALVIGDVSFLHDLSGLAAARQVKSPLVIVVLQNRGGRIFEQLPLASHPATEPKVFDHWLTPHDFDFSHAAGLYQLPFERVENGDDLEAALERALGRDGATVIEAMVPPRDAAHRHRRLWRRIDAAFEEP